MKSWGEGLGNRAYEQGHSFHGYWDHRVDPDVMPSDRRG